MAFIDLDMTFRPIDKWPSKLTPDWERRRAPFKAKWMDTVGLLERELRMLDAEHTVVQVALDESQIRLDGRPRAAAVASHPGVIIAFDSKHGPLQYSTDKYESWQENIRAIALALESLRRVDRYGVSKQGEQYKGWRQLTQTTGPHFAGKGEAAEWLADIIGYYDASDILDFDDRARDAYISAAKKLHPDAGGSEGEFRKLVLAKEVLGV
jgi:hypothetical protein